MSVYYQGRHRTQFDGGALAGENCTPTSGANGARCATGGAVDRSGTQIRSLVARSEETNPATAGWSLTDLDLAMSRISVPFSIGTGGWDGLRSVRASGRGTALQGDSDQFTTGCSGAFDGNHCIYVHPETNSSGLWLIGDPICSDWRWEHESVLKAYASKFNSNISYGVFTTPVPKEADVVPIKVDGLYDVDLTVGDQLYDLNYQPLVKVSVAQKATGYFNTGTGWYAIRIAIGGVPQLVLVKGADVSAAFRAPTTTVTGFTQADLDAAKQDGIDAEKAAIRLKLGL